MALLAVTKLTSIKSDSVSPTILFSVITTTRNCVEKIDATVQSVLAQGETSLEYLLIDGGSTDGTIDRLRSYDTRLRFVSEADHGIYDAMNKGVRIAKGKFLYFLGAGDRLRPGVLKLVSDEIARLPTSAKSPRPMLLYGNVNWPRYKRPYNGKFNRFKLLRSNICHQAIFYEKTLFARLGCYNVKYRLLSDWAHNIRAFNDRGIDKRYLSLQIADFECGGASNDCYDEAFYMDFRYLVQQECAPPETWLMHLAFLLAHPRALLGEPARQGRRLLRAWGRTWRKNV